jgi:hypothetical protein
MSKKEKYCGECRYFGYEDVYGVGYCLKKESLGFQEMGFCDQEACEDFQPEKE